MRKNDKLAEYETLIGALYDSVLDDGNWERALQCLGRLTGSPATFLMMVDEERDVPLVAQDFGCDPAAVTAYNREFAPLDPTYSVASLMSPGDWFIDYKHLSRQTLEHGQYYQEFMRPHGLRSLMVCKVIDANGLKGAISLLRFIGQPDYDDEVLAWAQRAFPHLQRAARLYARFGELRTQATFGTAALERLVWPVWVVDGDSRVKLANSAGEAAARGNGLLLHEGRLCASGMAGRQSLSRLLRQAVGREGPARSGGVRLPRGGGLTDLHVVVTPLPARSPFAGPWQEPLALVLVPNPDGAATTPETLMREVFGLTPAEARLAHLLAGGHTPAECADILTVSIATVRTQLRALYVKTGADRLSGLIRVLHGIAMLRL